VQIGDLDKFQRDAIYRRLDATDIGVWRHTFADYALTDTLFELSIQYCEQHRLYSQAMEALKKNLYVTTADGNPKPHPAANISRTASETMRKIMKHILSNAPKREKMQIRLEDLEK
jgi:phage terminase small subunit